jgi:hypothetical protein
MFTRISRQEAGSAGTVAPIKKARKKVNNTGIKNRMGAKLTKNVERFYHGLNHLFGILACKK